MADCGFSPRYRHFIGSTLTSGRPSLPHSRTFGAEQGRLLPQREYKSGREDDQRADNSPPRRVLRSRDRWRDRQWTIFHKARSGIGPHPSPRSSGPTTRLMPHSPVMWTTHGRSPSSDARSCPKNDQTPASGCAQVRGIRTVVARTPAQYCHRAGNNSLTMPAKGGDGSALPLLLQAVTGPGR